VSARRRTHAMRLCAARAWSLAPFHKGGGGEDSGQVHTFMGVRVFSTLLFCCRSAAALRPPGDAAFVVLERGVFAAAPPKALQRCI
jgi:hypothetical protein